MYMIHKKSRGEDVLKTTDIFNAVNIRGWGWESLCTLQLVNIWCVSDYGYLMPFHCASKIFFANISQVEIHDWKMFLFFL